MASGRWFPRVLESENSCYNAISHSSHSALIYSSLTFNSFSSVLLKRLCIYFLILSGVRNTISIKSNSIAFKRGDENVILCIVGNKSDLSDERQISTEEGEKKAKLLGAKIFMETSTKAGYNVKALFKKIAKSLPEFQNSESTPLDSENANSANQNKPGVIDISTAEEQEQSACQC